MKTAANVFSGIFILVVLIAILVPAGKLEKESAKTFQSVTQAVGVGSLFLALGCWAASRRQQK